MTLSCLATASDSRPALRAGAVAAILALFGASASALEIKPYFEFKKPAMISILGDLSLDTNGQSAPVFYSPSASGFVKGFEGVSQYDAASFGRNAIPPDTNGAVGKSQFMEVTNGAYAVFDKATGTRTALVSDVAFWATAGQTGARGDSRVMYNADAQRWIATSFGASLADLQIAVSNTSDALGGWKSTKFTGFAGGIADYPTLALDKNAVYIGTNNFMPSFKGTTMNVIPLDSLFNAVTPTVTNMKQFVTPYNGTTQIEDRGFAQQGVNSRSMGSRGTVLAASLFKFDNLGFKVDGLTPSDATGASIGATTFSGMTAFDSPGKARQPSVAIAANRRVVDSLDERISSSVYESGGLIYSVQTVNSGSDYARVRYTVLDGTTLSIVDQGDIGTGEYDYYQGSIAVNSQGRMVISYNRSGLDTATGKISIMARAYATDAARHLYALSDETLIKESLTDDYHNGSLFDQAAAGRQRWGDYSQVTIDPENENSFWLIGEFAREYNLAQFGHPGGSGGSRWGTYIAQFNAVPEPGTMLMVVLAFAAAGVASRRRVTH